MRFKFTIICLLSLGWFVSFAQQKQPGQQSIIKSKEQSGTKNPEKKAVPSASQKSSPPKNFEANDGVQLTGVWRGHFTSGNGFFREMYKYEVQIDQKSNNAVKGVTYSYKTTVFYGKSDMQGIFMSKDKNIIIKETKLTDVKIADMSEPCLMTCYLDYTKVGNSEILEGTFTSVNINNQKDCGSGTVYLEKVANSDFVKEDFVKEFENKKKLQTNPEKRNTTNTTSKPDNAITTPSKKLVLPPNSKPPFHNNDNSNTVKPNENNNGTVVTEKPKVVNEIPVPKVIKDKDNPLVQTIITASPDIKIEMYDNGQIDHDTISVYHNNQLVINKQMLNYKPITINLKADLTNRHHEFVMVADNLGEIPPNTALMVLTTGGKRYEIFITTNDQKNAKVVVEYQPPSKEGK